MPQDAVELEVKSFGPLEIKDEAQGYVEAVVGTINEVDHDGDVFLPGVVGKGAKVKLSGYGHDMVVGGAPPAGRGTITEENGRLILRGHFYMTTSRGREAFFTTKEEGEDGQWSVGFPRATAKTVKLSEEWAKKGARRLISEATMIETSPVLRGAQHGTGTLAVKEAVKEGVKEAVKEAGEEAGEKVKEAEAEAVKAAAEAEAAKKAEEEKAEAERLEVERKAAEEAEAEAQRKLQADIDAGVERFQRTQRLFNP